MKNVSYLLAPLLLISGLTLLGCTALNDLQGTALTDNGTTQIVPTNNPSSTPLVVATTNRVTDIVDAGFGQYVLIAMNSDGSNSETEQTVGELPVAVTSFLRPQVAHSQPHPIRRYYDRRFLTDHVGTHPAPKPAALSYLRPAATTVSHTTSTHSFWGYDGYDPIQIQATLRYGTATSNCLVFAQENKGTTVNWTTVGRTFDTQIYAQVTEYFGTPTDVDDNGKVVILYYEMPSDIYTAGFFYAMDLYEPNHTANNRNGMEVFHMNLLNDNPEADGFLSVLAHEFQHMVNFGTRVLKNSGNSMDAWLDEGLAVSAQHLYTGGPFNEVLNTFKQDPSKGIANGWPLSVWIDNEFEPYAMSYTFLQYCRIHAASGHSIYKKLIDEPAGTSVGLESIMKTENTQFTNYQTLLIGYRAALVFNKSDGIYGFKSEGADFVPTDGFKATTTSDVSLKAGGAINVYTTKTQLQAFTPDPDVGSPIHFIRISPETL